MSTVVALLMVPLIGFAAISLDVSGLWLQRAQLQAGADAGALAVAQDCARGACGSASSTAQTLVGLNLRQGTAQTTVTAGSGRVQVVASSARTDLFAPILGVRSSTVHASATVAYGSPTAGTAVLPLAFSWCEWQQQTQGGSTWGTSPRVIYLTKTSTTTDCTGPSGNYVPGGFGWLTVNSGTCGTKTSLTNIIVSDPGNSVPSGCSTSSFSSRVGSTVLLPLFDNYGGTGSGATYRIYAYAAFKLTGYHFGGQYDVGNPCNGNGRCVQGYFLRYVDLSEAFTYGAQAPQTGLSIVRLTA